MKVEITLTEREVIQAIKYWLICENEEMCPPEKYFGGAVVAMLNQKDCMAKVIFALDDKDAKVSINGEIRR